MHPGRATPSIAPHVPTPPDVDRALIERLTSLSRLFLPAERHEALAQRLQRIVAAFGSLAEVADDAERATPAAGGPLRADVPGPTLSVDEVLANAPAAAANCFVVPRVVDA